MPAILPPQRHLFDIPADLAYFNCATNAPQLNTARAALEAGARSKSHPWNRTADDFFADAETIRALAADIFGGDADGYAILPAASYGLSTAARAIEPQLQAGDVIVLIAEEFPSNVLPWRRVAAERGAVLRTVPTPADSNWTKAILAAIDDSVKVVSISTCHWTNGAAIDVQAIADVCHSAGMMLVVDATQSLGAVNFALADIKPDFLISAGYKWLLCPYGFGLMHVSEAWRQARPLEEGWLSRSGAENFANLVNYSDIYAPGARRFDVGEVCTPTLLPGAIATLQQLGAWGIDTIAASLAAINERIARHLKALGFGIPPADQRSPNMFGAQLPKGVTTNLVAALKAENVHIAQRGTALRFAPHLHVTEADLTRLFSALDRSL